MVKRGAVTKLLGSVVLSAPDDHRIRSRMLIDELELGQTQAFVEGVVPGGASVAGFVETSVGSCKHGQVISGMRCEAVIIGMNVRADFGDGPGSAGVHRFVGG